MYNCKKEISSRPPGRPTGDPKKRKIQSRIDEETDGILVAYCEKKGVSESEAVRHAIRKLLEEL